MIFSLKYALEALFRINVILINSHYSFSSIRPQTFPIKFKYKLYINKKPIILLIVQHNKLRSFAKC